MTYKIPYTLAKQMILMRVAPSSAKNNGAMEVVLVVFTRDNGGQGDGSPCIVTSLGCMAFFNDNI